MQRRRTSRHFFAIRYNKCAFGAEQHVQHWVSYNNPTQTHARRNIESLKFFHTWHLEKVTPKLLNSNRRVKNRTLKTEGHSSRSFSLNVDRLYSTYINKNLSSFYQFNNVLKQLFIVRAFPSACVKLAKCYIFTVQVKIKTPQGQKC